MGQHRPMSEADPFQELLAANQEYALGHRVVGSPKPSRRLAVVTCMDTRIDPLAVLGLHVGEAHVIRNAGGRMTEDVARSLALSSHVLEVNSVAFMQHTECGLAGATNEELQKLTAAGTEFLPIGDHSTALEEDIARLVAISWLNRIDRVAGLLFDVTSGAVTELTRWSRST